MVPQRDRAVSVTQMIVITADGVAITTTTVVVDGVTGMTLTLTTVVVRLRYLKISLSPAPATECNYTGGLSEQ